LLIKILPNEGSNYEAIVILITAFIMKRTTTISKNLSISQIISMLVMKRFATAMSAMTCVAYPSALGPPPPPTQERKPRDLEICRDGMWEEYVANIHLSSEF
jgi:hypothetical protein